MTSIDNADMYGNLTRVAMAKMVANYVLDLGLQELDTDKECNFPDVSASLDEAYDNGVTKACQLGLMGVGIEKFNPNGIVTRAEFGTVLSRALWGDEYNGADPYYKAHLEALKAEGIMTKIDNPNMKEVRGYVMLMMQRADEDYTPAVGCSAEELLACILADDYEACIAACSDEEEEVEVKAGNLTVSLGDSLANGTQIPNVGIVKFATVNFKAASSDVSLKTVKLMKVGLSDVSTSTRVWFENNGVRVTGRTSFTSDGEAYISFAPAYVVKAGSTEMLDLYVELPTGTAIGTDMQFRSEEVTSTAQSTNGSFTTPALRTASYAVNVVEFDGVAVDTVYGTAKVTDNGVELGDFMLKNNSTPQRDLTVKSITLRQNEAAGLDNLSNIVLERNGVVVSNGYSIDGKYLTLKVNDTISKDTASVKYTLKAVVNDVETASDKYEFKLNNTSDLNVIETLNGFRASIEYETAFEHFLGEVSVNGGDLTFARDTTLELTREVPAGSPVTLMKGSLTSKEAVSFEDITLKLQTSTNDLSTYFTTLYLRVGNSVFSYTPTTADTAGDDIVFEGAANINGKVNVELYGTLRNGAAGTVKFGPMNIDSLKDVEYVSNGIPVVTSVGSIAGISVTIQSTLLNVTRVDGLGDTTVSAGTDNVTLYKIKLSSNQGNGVRVSNAKFDVVTNPVEDTTTPLVNESSFTNNTTLTLLVNGVEKESKTFNGTSPVSFTNFGSVTVNSTTDATVEIVANIEEDVADGETIRVTLNDLTATDLLTSSAIADFATPAGAVFEVNTADADVSINKDLVLSKLLLSPSTNERIAAIKLAPEHDRVRLYNVVFTIDGAEAANNYRLVNASGTTIATATSIVGNDVSFTNMANTPFVEKDKSESYYLVADINSNVSTATPLIVTLTSANGRASNGTTVGSAVSTSDDAHVVFDRSVVVAKVDQGTNKDVISSALKFTVTVPV